MREHGTEHPDKKTERTSLAEATRAALDVEQRRQRWRSRRARRGANAAVSKDRPGGPSR
jgi:hypothetical protein